MRASTDFTKAIQICLFLNIKEGEFKSSTQLAESVDTNPVVVRRLLAKLKKNNIVNSIAGAQGGFLLAKTPEQISLWMIYKAVQEEQLFARHKINNDCDISCNLELLVQGTFDEAELSMKPALEESNIANLSFQLLEILEDSQV